MGVSSFYICRFLRSPLSSKVQSFALLYLKPLLARMSSFRAWKLTTKRRQVAHGAFLRLPSIPEQYLASHLDVVIRAARFNSVQHIAQSVTVDHLFTFSSSSSLCLSVFSWPWRSALQVQAQLAGLLVRGRLLQQHPQ